MDSDATTQPAVKDLVLVGGGHSHVEVIRRFGMRPEPGLRLTVVSGDALTPYSGMMPGLLAGHYEAKDCHIDLRALCSRSNARLIQAQVNHIDTQNHRVACDGRPELQYDILSINTGSRPSLNSIAGASDFGVPLKPIDVFLSKVERLTTKLADSESPFHLAVVGGGPAGIEVALAFRFRLTRMAPESDHNVSITLLTQDDSILANHNSKVRSSIERTLVRQRIQVITNITITAAGMRSLKSASEQTLQFDEVFWAVQAGAPTWLQSSGLALDANGFVLVDQFLRSANAPEVFAAGDICAFPGALAKSGVYAVRQGPILANNLRAAYRGAQLRPYHAQRQFLSLISTGDRRAVASRGGFHVAGRWVWYWKDWIDRRFMDRYRTPPRTGSDRRDDATMRCGGCGAKLPADTLEQCLSELRQPYDTSVLVGLSASDDAAVLSLPENSRLAQTLDFFPSFLNDPWLFARIAVIHSVGDLHAMGAQPHSALVIAGLPHAALRLVAADMKQMMQGAMQSLIEEGMTLLGGHSAETRDAVFGLAANGLLTDKLPIPKGPLRAGQCIILTKALGTGTILAANGRGLASAQSVNAAIDTMLVSCAAAMQAAGEYQIASCTDVTGFGLLGHLLEMLRGSDCGVELDIDSLPIIAGAASLLATGIESTLAPSNRDRSRPFTEIAPRLESERIKLLDDPQTAGGLLFAVDQSEAPALVRALHDAGYRDASTIGIATDTVAAGRIKLK